MFHKKIKELLADEGFKDWISEHKDFFLAHAFFMEGGDWQFGFYSPVSEKMVTFKCGDKIVRSKEEDILKSDKVISKLDPDKVVISFDDALAEASKVAEREYPSLVVSKRFLVIQVIDDTVVFNITFLAQNFNTINFRIDAKTGKVLHHSAQALASF
ncbi:hypothetical protein DRJ25_01240 [Candidatus Woesearchaeota archaeon]|nr:MAG: hypothetical protein DRJ25_01240 [Candidatus Woesearchaeota archaeon]